MTEPEAMSQGRRAWQQQLPLASNPYTDRGRPGGDRVGFHLWLAGYYAERAKSEQG